MAAAEPAKFQQDLLHVKSPIHVATEGKSLDSLGSQNATIAPRRKLSSFVLREPVFDVAEWLKKNGLELPEGSKALFSPGEQLLFVNSTPDDLVLARVILEPFPRVARIIWTADLDAELVSPGKPTKSIISVKNAPMVSGQRSTYRVTGETSLTLSLEPVIGPDDEAMDLGVAAAVDARGKSISMETMWYSRTSKRDSTTLGKLGAGSVVLRMQMHRTDDYWGLAVLETPEKKAEAIKEIQAALTKAP